MIVFLCVLLFFIFLFSLKATVTVEYNGEVELSVRVLFIKIKILPSKQKRYSKSMSAKKAAKLQAKLKKAEQKKKAKKADKKQKKAEKKQAIAEGRIKKEKKTPQEILDIISLVTSLLKSVIGKFCRHLRIRLSRIHLRIGTGDAATTAVTYGAVTQALNVMLPLLEGVKQVRFPKGSHLSVEPDFLSEESEIDICISFALRVWHLFHIAFAALWQLIKYFFKAQKRKAERSPQAK